MRIVYGAKDFASGLSLNFLVFNLTGTLLATFSASEVGTTGVYHYDIPFPSGQEYIVGVTEPGSVNWKVFKYIVT